MSPTVVAHKNVGSSNKIALEAKEFNKRIVRLKTTGPHRFKREFLGLADLPVVFQGMRLDKNLRNKTSEW